MEKDIKKKLIIPFIIALGFIVVGINSLLKGIEHHETWRIVLASVGILLFLVLVVLVIHTFIKNRNATA